MPEQKYLKNDDQTEQPSTSLLFGPYTAPSVRPGDWLFDERYGLIEVGGYTTNRNIHWPRARKGGTAQLILCGDLIRAVKNEAAVAVAHNWGVSVATVWYWRKALNVKQINPGTLRLYKQLSSIKLSEDVAARGREKARSPESLAKMAATKRGKPMHPATREALRKAITRPKPPGWGVMANQWMLAGKKNKVK